MCGNLLPAAQGREEPGFGCGWKFVSRNIIATAVARFPPALSTTILKCKLELIQKQFVSRIENRSRRNLNQDVPSKLVITAWNFHKAVFAMHFNALKRAQ